MFTKRGVSISLIACILLACLLFTLTSSHVEGKNLKAELNRLLKLKKQLKSKWNPNQYLNERIIRIARRFKIVIPRRCKRRVIIDDEVIRTIRKLVECDKETTPVLPPSKPDQPPVRQPEKPTQPTTPSNPSVPSKPVEPVTPETPSQPSQPSVPSTPSQPSNPSVPTQPNEPSTPSVPSNPDVPVTPETPSQPSNPETPTTHCTKKMCLANCPNGFVFDSRGCQTCQCKSVSCPKIACGKSCPHGFVYDSRGCKTCTCKTNRILCARVACKNSCPNGFVYNSHGCKTCTCKTNRILCARVVCKNSCPNGYQVNERGCRTCTCNPSNTKPPVVVRPPRHPPVRPPRHPPVRPPRHPPVRPPRHPPVRPPRVIRPTPVAPPVRPPRVIVRPPPVIVRPPPPPQVVRPPPPTRVINRGPNWSPIVWGVARGDPHYVLLSTGDEILFNGLGDYILAETEDKEFVAHVRIGKWHKKATVNTAIAVKLGSDIVEFNSKSGNFYLNKEEAQFKIGEKHHLDGGYILRKTKKTFVIKSSDGAELFGERFTLHDGKSYMDIQVDAPKELEFKRGLVIDGKGKQGKGLFRSEKKTSKLPKSAAVIDIPQWAMEACQKRGLTDRKLTDCAYDAAVSGEEYADEIAKDEVKFAKRSKKLH